MNKLLKFFMCVSEISSVHQCVAVRCSQWTLNMYLLHLFVFYFLHLFGINSKISNFISDSFERKSLDITSFWQIKKNSQNTDPIQYSSILLLTKDSLSGRTLKCVKHPPTFFIIENFDKIIRKSWNRNK